MEARFRIRTREGEELAPTTVETFSEMVRSGVVRPHDRVFDALTGEWAPASAHPIVRLFHDPLVLDSTEEAPRPSSEAREESLPGTQQGVEGDGELALDLVELDPVSPADEARAFIARMDEERRSDPERSAFSHEMPLVDADAGTVVGLPPPPAPPIQTPAPRPLPETADMSAPSEAEAPYTPRPREVRSLPRGWMNVAILGGAIVALILSMLWPPEGEQDLPREGVAEAAEARRPDRAVPVTEEQARELALAAYLEGVEALRYELGVGEVPSVWLEGRYLADPEAYPEVRRYWERYLAFVEAAVAAEVPLYRGAYLQVAADAGLAGPVRSLRLAAAQGDFEASRARRDELYARVEGLARAALALDHLLVEMKGRVRYEPIAGLGVSADPVIEAVGADADAQALLEAALDRVLEALQGPRGVQTRDRAGVAGWLVAGLRDVEGGRTAEDPPVP